MNFKNKTLRIGTRSSPLAIIQANIFQKKLKDFFNIKSELILINTIGDEIKIPLRDLGGKALFSSRLHSALRSGWIDCAIHSLKDLEPDKEKDINLVCIFEKEDPRDVLIVKEGNSPIWQDLQPNSTVGTCSIRRFSQSLLQRPDLKNVPIRGNIQTRLDLLKDLDAIILAYAALKRLSIEITSNMRILEIEEMMPAVGQGCLAVEILNSNCKYMSFLKEINDEKAFEQANLERFFLKELSASCNSGVGVNFELDHNCKLEARYADNEAKIKEVKLFGTFNNRYELAKDLAQKIAEN